MDEYEHYGPGQPMNAADVAAIIAERDRLRAVVEAARAVLAVIDSTTVGQLVDGIEGHDEITLLRVRLDQLDGSADMGDPPVPSG